MKWFFCNKIVKNDNKNVFEKFVSKKNNNNNNLRVSVCINGNVSVDGVGQNTPVGERVAFVVCDLPYIVNTQR